MTKHASAQQLFEETYGRPLSKAFYCPSPYPILSKMVKEGLLPYIDFELANTICSIYGYLQEDLCALISFLSLTSRQGHLCVSLLTSNISPDLQDSLKKNRVEENIDTHVSTHLINQYRDLIFNAVIPASLITHIDDPLQRVSTPLCQWNDFLYLQRNWFYESYFHQHYIRISQQHIELTTLHLDTEKLLPEQALAVSNVLKQGFSIIAGGPGTGKTYTAGMVIRTLWNNLSEDQKQFYKIALGAPTGKAAAQLERSINNFCGGLFAPLKAQTLHSLLNLKDAYTSYTEEWKVLDADFVLIDECSMLDMRMMAHLFAGLKPGAHLVLLGDPHQLPPIENGAPFADLVEFYTHHQSPVVSLLKTCMRAEIQSIVQLAEQIDGGYKDHVMNTLQHNDHVKRLDIGDPLPEIIEWYPSFSQSDEKELFQSLRQFCLLSPLRKGPYGVDELNDKIFKLIHRHKREVIKIPIMILTNNSESELSNGDLGILVKHKNNALDYGIFAQRDGEGYRKIPALLLPRYEYAYCMSVHKSQGSEFDCVCVLLPEGSEVFGREVLYTAVTRAKKSLMLWTTDETLEKTIDKAGKRQSGMPQRLSRY